MKSHRPGAVRNPEPTTCSIPGEVSPPYESLKFL